jgi:hypothetical protein
MSFSCLAHLCIVASCNYVTSLSLYITILHESSLLQHVAGKIHENTCKAEKKQYFLYLVRHFAFHMEFACVMYAALTKARFLIRSVAVLNEIVRLC